ncbi:MAG: chromosomal replication initiator protein DnaA [Lachnospiraceae bacterium]|jgi:chromosomal replication initiator protein|nr:chromosomal replication initiator protein DnaA [Lachnospiraceae bacterium]MBP5599244.1 chromosomal replication initiator protein DnaA [Lachnospiraceae bacterium]MCR4933916.1 chromosomal replication initiator protein DnaA [Lachnospiraceae bacterium]
MSGISEKWDLIKETVRKEYELTDVSFNTWIMPLKFHSIENDTVVIIIPSEKAQSLSYINMKYGDPFHVTISEMFNHEYDVVFKLEKDVNTSDSVTGTVNNVYNINSENANLNPKYKFDTFVVGSNNKMAHAASLAVAESPGTVYNPLYIYGGAGLGKTHLMHAIGHFILEQNPNMKVLYVTSEQFTNEVIESVRSGNATAITKLREKYRTVDVLMVDDVQFIIGKDATQEEFFNTFNALHSTGKQIVLSSDKPPKKMETLEERFRSRFEWGLITDIQAPDYETRMAILMKNAENCDRYINKEIIEYIATNIKSNIRELEGAFNKIIAYSKLNNVEMNLQRAEEALRDVIYPDKPLKLTPSYITDIVAEHFGVKAESIYSKKRSADIALPRQIAMYLCTEMTDYSLNEIGAFLGNRDHTTVMHGRDKIAEDIKKNPDLASKIEIIISKISPN